LQVGESKVKILKTDPPVHVIDIGYVDVAVVNVFVELFVIQWKVACVTDVVIDVLVHLFLM